jgi:hypothetical protein
MMIFRNKLPKTDKGPEEPCPLLPAETNVRGLTVLWGSQTWHRHLARLAELYSLACVWTVRRDHSPHTIVDRVAHRLSSVLTVPEYRGLDRRERQRHDNGNNGGQDTHLESSFPENVTSCGIGLLVFLVCVLPNARQVRSSVLYFTVVELHDFGRVKGKDEFPLSSLDHSHAWRDVILVFFALQSFCHIRIGFGNFFHGRRRNVAILRIRRMGIGHQNPEIARSDNHKRAQYGVTNPLAHLVTRTIATARIKGSTYAAASQRSPIPLPITRSFVMHQT